jgi:ATP-dependent exoDNAse (exonuclease V) beta subunit
MPEPWMTLLHTNAHPRDAEIQFDEPTHIYTVQGSSKGIISCTKFLHEFFGHFDSKGTIKKMMASPKWTESKWYKPGITAKEIEEQWNANGREASGAGTAMHLAIEQFLNGSEHVILPHIKETAEWRYFMNFWREHGADLEPYRTEWEVWSEDHKLAGQIDMVYRRKSDGKFLIYDWKRSKEIKTENKFQTGLPPLQHLPDCNYWHYTLQLNVYRWFLENLYGLEIEDMYLLVLHPDNKNYKRIRLNRLDEEVEAMLDCRRRAVLEGLKQTVVLPLPAKECLMEDDDDDE